MRKYIIREMEYEFEKVYHFTDSMIVRDQIKNESRVFDVYTGVRLGEIQEVTDIDEWFWIPTESNPADLATRLKTSLSIEELRLWKHGLLE